MPVEDALARHRALAADVKGSQRIHLARVGDTHDHAKLLIYLRVRRGRLHAADIVADGTDCRAHGGAWRQFVAGFSRDSAGQ